MGRPQCKAAVYSDSYATCFAVLSTWQTKLWRASIEGRFGALKSIN
jgi:hypothetical protein